MMSFRSSVGILLLLIVLEFSLVPGFKSGLAKAQGQVVTPQTWTQTPVHSSRYNVAPVRSQVFDREGLMQIKTFCVAPRHVEPSEAARIREFLTNESQPGRLLSKLPWTLTDDCAKADAVARIYFALVKVSQVREYRESNGSVTSESKAAKQRVQPVLLIYDKASIRLFYRAEGNISRGELSDVLGSPFAMLAKDLKTSHP